MALEKALATSRPLVDAGIVLHGAGAERVEMGVDRIIALGKAGKVAHDLRLGELRKHGLLLAQQMRRQTCRYRWQARVKLRQSVTASTSNRFLQHGGFGSVDHTIPFNAVHRRSQSS